MSEQSKPSTQFPKVGECLYVHVPEEAFLSLEQAGAFYQQIPCVRSAKELAGKTQENYLILECQVVQRVPGTK